MRFEAYIKDVSLHGELLYIQKEQSLQYRPHNPNIGVGIICGFYTELGVICETGEVVGFSGLNPHGTWIPMKHKMPESLRGDLIVHFDLPPVKGTGIEYDRSWNTHYNKKENCLCIGDYDTHKDDNCIEFANGIVAVLRGNQLVAIWAKIREVKAVVS